MLARPLRYSGLTVPPFYHKSGDGPSKRPGSGQAAAATIIRFSQKFFCGQSRNAIGVLICAVGPSALRIDAPLRSVFEAAGGPLQCEILHRANDWRCATKPGKTVPTAAEVHNVVTQVLTAPAPDLGVLGYPSRDPIKLNKNNDLSAFRVLPANAGFTVSLARRPANVPLCRLSQSSLHSGHRIGVPASAACCLDAALVQLFCLCAQGGETHLFEVFQHVREVVSAC